MAGKDTFENIQTRSLDIERTFKINRVEVTSTAAELNILDGVTSTAAELNILDGVTSDAAELSTLASSGISNADLVKLAAVTSTADELNILDTVTATAAELNLVDNQVASAAFTVNAEGSDEIIVNIQLKDAAAADMATRAAVGFYLSSDANGDTVVAAATTLVAGTDGVMIEHVSNSAGMLISEADGDIDVVVGDTGTTNYYLVLIMPNGSLAVSGIIDFS